MKVIINFFLLFASLNLVSCKTDTDFIPEKNPELSDARYAEYLNLLEKEYEENNQFAAAFQLANLKANPRLVFKYLDNGIKNNPSHCEQIYEWYWLYDKNNFANNLVRADTSKFKNSVQLCDDLNKSDSYLEYVIRKEQEIEDYKNSQPLEDSSLFNLELVKKLELIHKDDQDIRIKMSSKNITEEAKKVLFEEMQKVDSINLLKIEKIFIEYGYPSRELVGKECNFTPALVIHHSNSLETRYKHLEFLENAVKDGLLYEGTLDMIKRRIHDMELDQTIKKP